MSSASINRDNLLDGRPYREFALRREGMIYAMDGGLWLHRHVWKGRPMAHLVSSNRERLIEYGRVVGLPIARLQFKPLKDPRTGIRRDATCYPLAELPRTLTAASRRERLSPCLPG